MCFNISVIWATLGALDTLDASDEERAEDATAADRSFMAVLSYIYFGDDGFVL